MHGRSERRDRYRWYECIHANDMLSSMLSLTDLVCPSRLSTSDSHKCTGHRLGQKVRLLSGPWPELRYNGWRGSGLDPTEAWVVPSSSTDMTPNKGGRLINSPYAKAAERETGTILLRLVGGPR